MSISTTTRKAGPFTGNGVTVSFPFAFKVFAAADVLVVRGEIATSADTQLTLGTHYSVTLNSDQDTNPGGTVNWIGTPLSSAFTLTIGSKVASTQPATFTNLGRFYPRVLNDALDRLTIVVQQLAEEVSRSVKVGFSGLVSPDELVSTITTAASTATAGAASAADSAEAAFTAVADAQDAITAANAAIAGALQKSGDTMTGALTLVGDADAPLKAVPKQQAESIATSAAASAVANRMQYSLTASQATTSGSAVDFVGIPSWAKRITVILNGVSINGSDGVSLLLRTAAGPVSSGYETISAYVPNGTPATAASGAQLLSCGAVAATEVSGVWTLNNFGGNTWVAHGGVYRKNDAGFQSSAGRITLADVVTGVRLQTGAAFDAGSVSLLIEG